MSTCRDCKGPILWAIHPETGRSMALDPRAEVYEVVGSDFRSSAYEVKRVAQQFSTGGEPVFLTAHARTCTASERRRSTRRQKAR